MKELAAGTLPEASRIGVWGAGACAYACPGCPSGVLEDGLRTRIVGWNERVADRLKSGPRRDWELAAGRLPPPESWPTLAQCGIRRALTPFFTSRLAGESEVIEEILAAHDAECGIPGAGADALRSLEFAREAGIEPVLLASSGRAGGSPSLAGARALTRVAWSRHIDISIVSAGASSPCIP